MSRGMAGVLGAVAALFGSPIIGDGTPRRRGGHAQPWRPRVNPPGTKAAKKLASRIERAKHRKGRKRVAQLKPQTKQRRERADGMIYLASIGKPTSGRQWRRLRKAIRREIGE